jgi:hypothetical protein
MLAESREAHAGSGSEAGVNRDRRAEPQQATSGNSLTTASTLGRTTSTQSLVPDVPQPQGQAMLAGSGAASVQHKAGAAAPSTSTTHQRDGIDRRRSGWRIRLGFTRWGEPGCSRRSRSADHHLHVRGLASLEEAAKTFGHEVQNLKDFAAGVITSSEDFAEEAGEKLRLVVHAMGNGDCL